MTYTIVILPEVERELAKLPGKIRGQIGKKIDRLAATPFPPGCTKLEGRTDGIYRIHSGDYRILYRVQQEKVLVIVVKVGDRKDVYRNI